MVSVDWGGVLMMQIYRTDEYLEYSRFALMGCWVVWASSSDRIIVCSRNSVYALFAGDLVSVLRWVLDGMQGSGRTDYCAQE